MHRRLYTLVSLTALATTAGSLRAAVTLQSTLVASGFAAPTFLTGAPGDTTHLYILEKGTGTTANIRVYDTVTHFTSTFLTLNNVATAGEQGLLGLAFDPNYATNGNFYVDYSATTTISGAASVSTIAAYHANSATSANPTALGKILTVTETDQTNHKGGWIAFSPRAGDDHNLYISLGDGGNGNDVGTGHVAGGNAQSTSTLLGKILRIHVDSATPTTYTIPANNPFATSVDPNVKKEIFDYGLRNPFRNSFDRVTGTLYIGDVGQDTREELDVQKTAGGGENYGWNVREGFITTPTVGGPKTAGMTDPILDYAHAPGTTTLAGQTIIGGYVYRGSAIPSLAGTYIFGDYLGPEGVAGARTEIFSLNYDGTSVSALTDLTSTLNPGGTPLITNITSFGEDTAGELYIVDGGSGKIFKITAVPEPASLALMFVGSALLLRRRTRA